jgi:superfamily II DNA or RNA helicase/diadenosine tetraphosphate (Ap4A) HIT family hydrolase
VVDLKNEFFLNGLIDMPLDNQSRCIFCSPESDRVFYREKLIYALWDSYPVSEGHALLIPYRHFDSWFDATEAEQQAFLRGIDAIKEFIQSQYNPDGFNIGINVGAAAGQTVSHLHVHVMPRYIGDVVDPRGGVRHVIPRKANYLADPFGHSSSIPQAPHDQSLVRGDNDPLLPHLVAHIGLAHRADLAVSFTRNSGVFKIKNHLQDLLDRGGGIRFLTGDYLGITEPKALISLLDLKGDIKFRVYQTTDHSFHPKAYIFHNKEGSGVALVGSSNLSAMALEKGVEWNYRVITTHDQIGFNDVSTAFDALFSHSLTVVLNQTWIDKYQKRRQPVQPQIAGEPEEVPLPPPEPYDIQLRAMDALETTRQKGNQSGLIVLATGLGKTWLSAFDSNRDEFRRILFVAHREEILSQARNTFRRVHEGARFGYFTGQRRDRDADITFASVQTLSRSKHLQTFEPTEFDYIVMDEFHHASARTYRTLIDYFEPKFLLGLTATPERTDGGDLLQLCQENLVYRCDLVEGIEKDLLCPFQYFGVPDDVNYEQIPWRSHRFDEKVLTDHLATEVRAQNVLEQYQSKAGQKTLAFCCSKLHADYMKNYFKQRNVRAASVHSGENSDPRTMSLEKLEQGELDIIFSVDMFNEGLDIPSIDTVMMLRPTESRLLWLQQLGRGLRKSSNKEYLTVIDYIGNHKTFLIKYRALLEIFVTLGPGSHHLRNYLDKIEQGSLELPEGCYVKYDLETIDILKSLIPPVPTIPAIEYFYRDFLERYNQRPTAVEAFHQGYNPKSVRDEYGSWFHFVKEMNGLSQDQENIMNQDYLAEFLTHLEVTPMSKSYKMLTLLAMLNTDTFPDGIKIDDLIRAVIRLSQRSAKLKLDVNVSFDNFSALKRLLENNPIKAWVGGQGMGGTQFFAYQDGLFRFVREINKKNKEAFQELLRELVDWRLADYLGRVEDVQEEQIICKVSHSNGRPILFYLPNRDKQPGIPHGWQEVLINGENYKANFVKIAVNVIHKHNNNKNVIADILRAWFGQDAGLSGTIHKVVFISENGGFRLEPLGKKQEPEKINLWHSFTRPEVPLLFGLKFNTGLWQQGYVFKDNHAFLFVTLNKQALHDDFQYQDRFLSPNQFQWQSQNSTTQQSTKGIRLSGHKDSGIQIHLFVRETKMRGSKAAPFVYCGEVDFVSWKGERPITVQWKLREAVPEHLWQRLGISEGL